ncbi:MAG TPA: PfkB family carbohydrate kinase, partial [Sphingomicrobium sp.]|nr:PfkB family carbohydrate kinase [Sphingomicrobium sp.]
SQLGHRAEMVTVLPRSGLGDLCQGELSRTGAGTSKILRADGRLGLYFMEADARGSGRILYDRAHSVFVEHADEFDWHALSSDVDWLHLSGINVALGGKAATAALEAVEEASAAGATVSFDVNHRAALWEHRPKSDFDLVRRIASLSDILFASPTDLARLLTKEFRCETPDERRQAANAAFEEFERPRIIACTLRWFEDGYQGLSARIDGRETAYETKRAPLGVVADRIGSGDAFAAGVIDGLAREASIESSALRGLGAAVMKHALVGDRWIGTREELERFNPFVTGDVRR